MSELFVLHKLTAVLGATHLLCFSIQSGAIRAQVHVNGHWCCSLAFICDTHRPCSLTLVGSSHDHIIKHYNEEQHGNAHRRR